MNVSLELSEQECDRLVEILELIPGMESDDALYAKVIEQIKCARKDSKLLSAVYPFLYCNE